jgi:hypothetical protein
MEAFRHSSDNNNIDSQSLLKAVTNILKEIIKENKSDTTITEVTTESQLNSVFFAKKIPAISLTAYIDRILKYSKAEDPSLILALIYIDLLCDQSKFILNDHNIHRVLLTAIVIAIKFNEDDYFANSFYAKVGGISNEELNSLEYEFLVICNFSMAIRQEKYDKYFSYLKSLTSTSNEEL